VGLRRQAPHFPWGAPSNPKALHDFEPYGAGAADLIERTQRLIAAIQAAMR
jgi:hypothetical protein